MRASVIAGLLLAFASIARAQEVPVVGTFTVSGSSDKVVVRRSGDSTLELEAKLPNLPRSLHAPYHASRPLHDGTAYVGTGAWIFTPPGTPPRSPSIGLSGAVETLWSESPGSSPTAHSEVVQLRPLSQGQVELAVLSGSSVVSREVLVRQRSALVIHTKAIETSEANAFTAYAQQVAAYYRSRSFDHVVVTEAHSFSEMIAAISSGESLGTPFDRVVSVGHGGWDGPIIQNSDDFAQVSPFMDPEVFDKLTDAYRRGTTSSAKIFISSCHSGGSNAIEARDPGNAEPRYQQIYVSEIARATERTAAGPMGSTSTEWTLRAVKAALEGEGTVAQSTRLATPDGVRVIKGGTSRD